MEWEISLHPTFNLCTLKPPFHKVKWDTFILYKLKQVHETHFIPIDIEVIIPLLH